MKPIIVGVDGSKASIGALRWALSSAEQLGCALEVVTVVAAANWTAHPDFGAWLPGEDRALQHEGEAVLERALGSVVVPDLGIDVRRRVLMGVAGSRLAEFSAEASCIVIGSRRRKGLSRFLDASVQSMLLRCTTCPVVVVPEGVTLSTRLDVRAPQEMALAR